MKTTNLFISLLLQFVLVVSTQSTFAAAATNVKCNGCVDTKDISGKAVTTSKIKPGAITASKIKDGAVSASKISEGAVSGEKIKSGSVGSSKIQTGAVTNSKIGYGAVTADKITGGPGSGIDADTVDGLHASQLGVSYGITTTIRKKSHDATSNFSYASEVGFISCNAGEVMTGGTCHCFGDGGQEANTNKGAVQYCLLGSDVIVGYCVSVSPDSLKKGPGFTAHIVCAQSTTQSNVQVNIEALPIQSYKSTHTDDEGNMLSLEAQMMIDEAKMARDYYNEQMELKYAQ